MCFQPLNIEHGTIIRFEDDECDRYCVHDLRETIGFIDLSLLGP